MSDPVPDGSLSAAAEEALFQRLLQRFDDVRRRVIAKTTSSGTSQTALVARRVVESRRHKKEPIAQVLFRVPGSLRDEVKQLSMDERRQMDELLTEAVLDLLLKHGRVPTAFQRHASGDSSVQAP